RGKIAELAEARLKAGDASVQEVTTARIDALLASQDATRIRFEVPLAEERLKNLMGVPKITETIPVANPPTIQHPAVSVDALVDEAVHHRPDGLAALHAREAAEERLRFSKLSWIRLLGIADATSGKKTGHEFGPALRVTVPIFNQNQGGIARAEAELEQLTRRELVLRNQIITEVRLAAVRYEQARSEYEILLGKVKSEAE
uniref:TolC family protein n=1 Tax=Zavarzinella formosa TaxID=360055 RepID=UPI0003825446